jgi:hypothetical protein
MKLRGQSHVLFPLGLAVGITAYAMSSYFVGGWVSGRRFSCLTLFSCFRLSVPTCI